MIQAGESPITSLHSTPTGGGALYQPQFRHLIANRDTRFKEVTSESELLTTQRSVGNAEHQENHTLEKRKTRIATKTNQVRRVYPVS